MKNIVQSHKIAVTVAALFVVALSGCSQSQPQTNAAPPAASNVTPQQQQGAKSSAQRDGEMRAAMAKQQQSQTH